MNYREVKGVHTRIGVAESNGRRVEVASRRRKLTSTRRAMPTPASQKISWALRQPKVLSEWDSGSVTRLRNDFLHACLPLFFADEHPLCSLGLTSAVAGEGKTSAAWLVSYALATTSRRSIVLVECDWDRPTFSRDLGLPAAPGLAEYLSGTSKLAEIRYQFLPNLTVIPAGMGGVDAMTAVAQLQRSELYDRVTYPDELMILDLPSILATSYGVITARLPEALMMVVRAGDTPSPLVARACEEVKHLRVEGIILNHVQTRIPRWLQRLL
ncbi:MAG: hypothetical protein ACLQUY_12490 [Ktedonobacterales bacterium]